MDRMLLVFVAPLTINVGLGLFLVFTVSRQRPSPLARSLIALIFGAALWSFGYAMEFASPLLQTKLFWAKFQYFGITIIPVAWFSFASQSLGSPGWSGRPRKQRLVLAGLPLLTLGLAWTNELHGLIWRGVGLAAIGSSKVLGIDHGPVFWLYIAFSYCLLFLGSLKLLGGLLSDVQLNPWRRVAKLLAILIPWFGNLVYVTELNPIPHLDWSPFAFTISGLLFSISLYHTSLIDILPIAYRTIFALHPDPLMVLDAQNVLINLNAAALQMIGKGDIAAKGKPLTEVLPELADWVSLAGSSRQFRGDFTRGNAQDRRFYDLHMVALTSSTLGRVGRLIVCHEITQLKRQQAQLEQQYQAADQARSETRAILDAINEGMVLVGIDATFREVNYRLGELFGVPASELQGRTADELQPIIRRVFADPDRLQVRAAPDATDFDRQYTEFVVQREPVPRELELYSSPVRSTAGQYLGRLYSFRDVTREREVDRLKSQFISMISHELRTPLTSIKGYIELLVDGEAGELSEVQRRFLAIVKNNSDRLVSLINDLLDISRIESGKLELKRAPLDVNEILGQAAASLRPPIEGKHQCLTLDLATDLPPVWGDRGRVHQIVMNLLSNAHKYTMEGGAISIRSRAGRDEVLIDVADTGVGLLPEERAKLFTRFYRADNRATQQVGGTGLGLAITRSLVELHGGTISVDSQPGAGSIFTFTLPLAPQSLTANGPPEPAGESRQL